MGGEWFARFMGEKSWDRADKEGLAIAKENKNTFQHASGEFVAELTKVTAKLEADYAGQLDKLGLPGKKVIADFRAEVAKVASGK
jgi:hypothetical protein